MCHRILIVAMDDFSSSRIHEDAIIFSIRKINAWNATIQRGSIIILGGDREMLRDVLDYKRAFVTTNTELLDHASLSQCNSRANATAQRHDLVLTTSSPPPDEGFHLIQANDMKVSYSVDPFNRRVCWCIGQSGYGTRRAWNSRFPRWESSSAYFWGRIHCLCIQNSLNAMAMNWYI